MITVKTGGIVNVKYTLTGDESWQVKLVSLLLFSIPNGLIYSGIGLGIYCLGQWLGGQI